MLTVQDLTVRYGKLTIVDRVSFSVERGQWLMVVGPNGAGKSTVAGAISQTIPSGGQVLFDGRDISKMKRRELARRIGVLTQSHYVGYGFTTEEVIRLGRYAHSQGLLGRSDGDGEEKVQAAIRRTGLEPFLKQSVLTLSGGELQRTFLAQLLAQDHQLLILDEPTNHLDLVYQKEVFALVREWLDDGGGAVISVVHDLSLAKSYGTHALLMDCGRVVAQGTVKEVLLPERLNGVYRMDVGAWMRGLYRQWLEDGL